MSDSHAVEPTLHVNGAEHRVRLDVRTLLLDALREHLEPHENRSPSSRR